MRKKNIILFMILTAFTALSHAQERRQARTTWEIPPEAAKLLALISNVDPTLPAPKLFPEPPFTTGRSNTLYWSDAETRSMLTQENVQGTVLFYEIRAFSDSTGQLWGFVNAGVDSATFAGLPSGNPIHYNLRYYFQFAAGEYGLSFWSTDSTSSIQDVSIPEFSRFDITGLNSSGKKNWVTERTIELHVQAYDPEYGQVAQVNIREKSASHDNSILYDIDIPQSEVDLRIPYELLSDEHELVTLSLYVIDVAGQKSEVRTILFFWWKLVEMVCFPNPFNPESGEVSTIETGSRDLTEARIYDPFGNLVIRLNKDHSSTFFQWDGRNNDGKVVSNGGYFCVIDSDQKQYCKIAVFK